MIKRFKHLLGARAHGNIVSEVHPSDNAIRIEEKFGRARNVGSFGTGRAMQYVVSANDLRVRIGKQWKSIPELLRVPSVDIRWINTDADNANAARVEFRKPSLKTPQLGVA